MNKKLLILGAFVLVAGFFVFSAFGGKTREQQMAEIEQMVTMKLDELRAQKEEECTAKINDEAQRRFDEILAQREAEAAKPGTKPKSKPKSKGNTGGATVDPLPQPSVPTNPKADKTSGNVQQNTEQKQSKTAGEAPVQNTDKKKSKTSGGGGN